MKDAKELFDYDLSEASEETPLLSTFKDKDSNDFITDPEKPKA